VPCILRHIPGPSPFQQSKSHLWCFLTVVARILSSGWGAANRYQSRARPGSEVPALNYGDIVVTVLVLFAMIIVVGSPGRHRGRSA
jgi:hypothetical protein